METIQAIESQIITTEKRDHLDKDDIIAQVDKLIDGSDSDKQKANEILLEHKAKVDIFCLLIIVIF